MATSLALDASFVYGLRDAHRIALRHANLQAPGVWARRLILLHKSK